MQKLLCPALNAERMMYKFFCPRKKRYLGSAFFKPVCSYCCNRHAFEKAFYAKR